MCELWKRGSTVTEMNKIARYSCIPHVDNSAHEINWLLNICFTLFSPAQTDVKKHETRNTKCPPPPHTSRRDETERFLLVFAGWRASRFVASAGVRGLKNWFLVVGDSFW